MQWKSGSEEYDGTESSTRQAVVTDLDNLTYRIAGLTAGVEYTVRVVASNAAGDGAPAEATATMADTPETAAVNTAPTGLPVISGTPRVGETLTASADGIADADGLENATFAYQWSSNNGTSDADIDDATKSTYTVAAADVGKAIKVRVTFTDDGGTEETLVSEATDAVAALPTGLSVADAEATEEEDTTLDFVVTLDPAASGTVTVDYATADGTATAGDDYTDTSGALTFEAGDTTKTVSVPISDDAADDGGETLTLTLSNASGAAIADGEATGTIRDAEAAVEGSNTAATGAPTISGTPQVGETLTASVSDISDADGLDDASYGYQWIRGDADIEGATDSSYTLVSADEGETIKVRVTFSDDGGNAESVTSAASDPVEAAPNKPATGAPTISGTPQVDETLTASVSDISDADGLDDASYAYQWIGGDADIEGATDSSYTLVSADEGETIRVRVTFTDDGGNAESATSAASDPVEAAPNKPATGAPTISGTPQVDETLTASVSDISDADGLDNASFGYQWIRGDADIEGATDSSYTLVSADEGETIRVRVSFTDDPGHAESLASEATDAVAPAPQPLTATFADVPSEHAGEGGSFTFGLTFSEDFGLSYKTLRDDDAFDVSGGDVRRAKREQQGSNQSWTIHVEPSGHGPVTVTLPETTDCGASGAICTGDDRPLSHSLSATVAGPVGISVADARVEEGAGAQLAFVVTLSRAASGALTVAYATSDGSAQAGADYTAASGTLAFQAGESSRTIEVTVLDDSHDDGGETLTLTLSNPSSGRLADAEATGTIENSDPLPRALMARFGRTAAVHVVEHVEERLQAPREPGFDGRVGGRELRRGMERELALSFLSQLGVSVGANGYGVGGHDPMAGSPGAAFGGMGSPGMPGLARGGVGMPGAAGAADVGVPMLGAGTGAMGGAGTMGGAPGPMSAVAGLDGGPFGGGLHSMDLGGDNLLTGSAFDMTGAMGGAGMMGGAPGPMSAVAGPDGGLFGGGLHSMGLGGDNLLTGSAFAMNRESHGGILSFWSRGARSHFSGRDGTLSLGGDVRTTMFGADYAKGPLVAGLSLSHSRGLGEYAGVAAGQVASAVTGLYPWLGYKATDRVTVWGVAGYGRGGLLLTPDSGTALESGLSMAMAAAGTRGELIAGAAGGFALAFKADALWVGTAIDGVDGPAGRLKATDAAVTRFRTGLEGSRAYKFAGGLSLRPSVEVGLRQDGGDAETGAGMDVGAGLIVSDSSTGLAVDVRVRTLLVHQAEGFRERGMALSLSYNPTPSTPLGFTAKVAPSWGGQAQSGAEALWGRETMAGMGHGGLASGNRLDGEVGYGLPVGSRFVGTPRVGLSTSEYGRNYRVGYGLGVLDRASVYFELGVDAHRQENPMSDGADNGFMGRATLGW